MDILAHALWTAAAAIAARRKWKRPVSVIWTAAWGVLPDLVVFAIPAAVRIWRLMTGAANSLLPDGRGPRFEWVWTLYNATHSALVFATCFGAVWLLLRRPVWEMLGWALHILIDVFTHQGLFAINFLWPAWSLHLDGIRWETPWVLAVTYAGAAMVYLFLWTRRSSRANQKRFAPYLDRG